MSELSKRMRGLANVVATQSINYIDCDVGMDDGERDLWAECRGSAIVDLCDEIEALEKEVARLKGKRHE